MTEKLARVKSDQTKIEKTLERNRDVLRATREKAWRYSSTLATSGAEIKKAREDLEKIGILKG